MSIALEHIAPNDWSGVQRLVEVLGNLVIDTGGITLGIRMGNVAINTGTTQTVTHGLGRTPAVVLTSAANANIAIGADLYTSTTVRLANSSGANTTAYWVAFG